MNPITKLMMVFLLFAVQFGARGQTLGREKPEIYRAGDTLPNSFFDTVHQAVEASTGKDTTIRLADYRNRLVILYFWFAGCKPCIQSISKLDSLRAARPDLDFVVIPFTYESADYAKEWTLSKFKWNLVSIVADKDLRQQFIYPGFMNMAWIMNGKVVATPEGRFLTADNIRKIVDGDSNPFPLIVRQYVTPDPANPVFSESNLWYRTSFAKISRYNGSYGAGAKIQYLQKGDTTILYAINKTIEDLYFMAFEQQIFPNLATANDGIRWAVDDSLKQRLLHNRPSLSQSSTKEGDSLYEAWCEKNLYGYELRYPGKITEKQARKLMQEDINRFFGACYGVQGGIVPGPKLRYAVLKLTESVEDALQRMDSGSADGGPDTSMLYFPHHPFNSNFFPVIKAAVNKATDVDFTSALIDSTGIAPGTIVNVWVPAAMRKGWTINKINSELNRFGMLVDIREGYVPLLEVRQRSRITSKVINLTLK